MLLFAAGATNRRAFTGLSRTVKLKGYRTGHVPRRMVERYFGEDLKKNVAQELVTGSIHEALGEHKLDPVAPGRRKRRAGPTRRSDRRKGLNPRRPLRTMLAMRRSLAAIALSATLGYAVAPALAAACCPAAAPHACCTKTGNDATATRAPCCKRSPETATPRTEATPGSATRVAAPLAGALEHAPALATSSALAAPVRNLARPRSHALGPPLRLRI